VVGTGYRYLEHTADVMIEAFGASMGVAFSFAAEATFNVMIDLSKVNPTKRVKIEVFAGDMEGLLYSWLEELLFRFYVERMAFSEFKFDLIEVNGGMKGIGEARGEIYDPRKHGRKTEVKAITYSEMLITKTDRGATVRFILDV
jgi:SHS2 domain-containing protein